MLNKISLIDNGTKYPKNITTSIVKASTIGIVRNISKSIFVNFQRNNTKQNTKLQSRNFLTFF